VDRFSTVTHERPVALVGVLIAVCGAVAWVSGHPFLFPSLGPSAYLLATRPASPESAPHRVIGGHAIGTVAGLVSYSLFTPTFDLSALAAPLSVAGFRFAGAAVLSMVLTTTAMSAMGVRHPPACATTLLVALGVLSTLADAVIVLLAVGLLVCTQRLVIAIDLHVAITHNG
jgi:CBS-domain-containing membrane protein